MLSLSEYLSYQFLVTESSTKKYARSLFNVSYNLNNRDRNPAPPLKKHSTILLSDFYVFLKSVCKQNFPGLLYLILESVI